MRRLSAEVTTFVKRRAALIILSVLMIALFVALDYLPDLALLFLIAGVVIAGLTLFALKRQIESEMSRIQEETRAKRERAERARAERTRAKSADTPIIEAPAALVIPDIEMPTAATLEIGELAAEILTIDDLVIAAPREETNEKADIFKPYVAPSYDLFD